MATDDAPRRDDTASTDDDPTVDGERVGDNRAVDGEQAGDGPPFDEPPIDDPTVDDEIVARARIHAREVLAEHDLAVDRDALEWAVSARAKRRAGACRWDRDREVATIVLARRAYDAYDWPEFAEIVRHELIHAWEFQRFGESGHGSRFRERAAELDAPRHCRAFSEPRYVLRCLEADCDWRLERHRASKPVKNPGRYRCGDCGGSLEVEHAESGRTWESASGYGGAKAALGEEW